MDEVNIQLNFYFDFLFVFIILIIYNRVLRVINRMFLQKRNNNIVGLLIEKCYFWEKFGNQ